MNKAQEIYPMRLLLIAAYILAAQVSFAQVSEREAEPDRGFKYKEVVASQLNRVIKSAPDTSLVRELELLQRYVGLSDLARKELKDDLKLIFVETRDSGPCIPSQKVLQELVRAAKKADCDEQLLAQYQADLLSRQEFEQEMRMQQDVYFVDAIVGLREDQWESVRAAAGENYQKHLDEYWALTWYMDSSQEELESLRKVLDANQKACLNAFGPNSQDEMDSVELLQRFRLVAPMKLRQLDSIVKLSDSQKTKLKIAGSTTLTRSSVLQKQRLNLDDKKSWDFFMSGVDSSGLSDNEKLEVTNFSNLRLPMLFAEKRWQAFVDSTLSDSQRLDWQRFADRRLKAAIDVQANRIAHYFSELPLNSEQRRAVHELLKRSIELQENKLKNAFYRLINPNLLPAVITEEEFIEAIGKDNWEKVDPFCARALPISR
ncbi:MAG: hypothetical protein AAF483_11135 [Planctomycetota bacterium]